MSKRILIVDDDPLILRAFKRMLALRAAHADTVDGVEAAKKALLRAGDMLTMPDVVLSDWDMPDGTGADLCSWIHNGPKPWPKVVLMSGVVTDPKTELASQLGVRIYDKGDFAAILSEVVG